MNFQQLNSEVGTSEPSEGMHELLANTTDGQFSVAYLLGEMALIAIALGASRFVFAPFGMESQALCFCIAMTAASGAVGGLFLRMSVGLIVGGVFSVAAIPLLWVLITMPRG